MKKRAVILLSLWLMLPRLSQAEPARLICEGVLGNSGEQGETLVRFAKKRWLRRDGMGVVTDRFGTLWDRAGLGQINRYSLDGRLLASYELPHSDVGRIDTATLVGDWLLLFMPRGLWAMNVADETPEIEKVDVKVESIARSAVGDEILLLLAGEPRKVAFYKPADKTLRHVADLPVQKGELRPGVTPDGKALVFNNNSKQIYVLEGDDWQLKATLKDENPQMVDGYYWTGGWNGTLRRYDRNFAPAPGVVLGGNSGSFIGKLEGNYELSYPLGIAAVSPGVYALGGVAGVAHLAEWDDVLQRMTLIRRIGALDSINGHLALDGNGNVRVPNGVWEWKDGPDTPLLHGWGFNGNGQMAVFGNGSFFSAVFMYQNRPAIAWGRFDTEAKSSDRALTELSDDVRGCVALKDDRRNRSLRMTLGGRMIETLHDAQGKPYKDEAAGQLQLPDAAGEPRSLACLTDGRVLAAVGGRILEIERVDETSGDWRVVKALDAPAGETFGSDIFVTADAGWLWISDRENHRVIVADENLEQISAIFGDSRGSSLSQCDSPGTVAASGRRAVVYDSGNQRILKLRLP